LALPALRERPEDIPELIERFLREEGFEGPLSALFDSSAMDRLARRRWEGNIRELRNYVAATLAFGEEPGLEASTEDVPSSADWSALSYREAKKQLTDRFERDFAAQLLERTHGNVRAAARLGRMDRNFLADLAKRHGLRQVED
jgi:DNA-binding NtrC family response regulator